MKRQHFSRQSGFTLVEIAIVLVIIGLLLGGVLKGQEMIENAKIKNVINDLKGVSAAYYSYQDRYKAIPGDDAQAATRFTDADNGNGNGAIAGNYNATTGTSTNTAESNKFWQHTRMAGLLSGVATDTSALPGTHAAGGVLGVQSGAFGITGNVVCAGSVPWKMAISIDTQLDDGNGATGNVRGGVPAAGANVAPTLAATSSSSAYGAATAIPQFESGVLTVCMKL